MLQMPNMNCASKNFQRPRKHGQHETAIAAAEKLTIPRQHKVGLNKVQGLQLAKLIGLLVVEQPHAGATLRVGLCKLHREQVQAHFAFVVADKK